MNHRNELMRITQSIKAELTRYPEGYDIDTALTGAALVFHENKYFQQCTPDSKYRCILDMVVQGLDPLKGHCSFVPRKTGGKIILTLARDYSGSMLVAKRQDKRIADIRGEVIREGEHFEVKITNGLKTPIHEGRNFDTWNAKIMGTYAVAVDADNNVIDMDLMSADDVKRTWKNAHLTHKGEPVVRQDGSINPNSNHGKFPERMIRKTVIHRLCRQIIKSSNDTVLVSASDRSDEEQSFQTEIEYRSAPEPQPQKQQEQPAPQQQQPAKEPPTEPVVEQTTVTAEPAAEQKPQKINSETCKKIVQLSDLSTNLVDGICKFFNRQVGSMLDLTEAEGQAYIAHLSDNTGNVATDDNKPGWL